MNWASRRRGRAVALAVALGLAAALPPVSSAVAAPGGDRPGLRVTIQQLSPAVLQPGEPVRLDGRVENIGQTTWSNVKVYLWVYRTPITARADLARAIKFPPTFPEGARIIDLGTFKTIADRMSPGTAISYRLRVPFGLLDLPARAGVYWIGTHVLANNPDGSRDSVADARARTFAPYFPPGTRYGEVEMSMLWPVTARPTLRQGDRFLGDRLAAGLAPTGRLGRLLAAAEGLPVSWVIDPALVESARRMADGYRVADADGTSAGTGRPAAQGWLDQLELSLAGQSPLLLPYGDADPTSLVHDRMGQILRTARAVGEQVPLGTAVERLPTAWPVHGLADRATLEAAARTGADVAVLSPRTLPGASEATGSVVDVETSSRPLTALVIDPALFAFGPDPGPRRTHVQVRQRLLSETALTALGASGQRPVALVASPPRYFDPATWRAGVPAGSAGPDFFAALGEAPWLRVVPAVDLLDGRHPRYDGPIDYPRTARMRELAPDHLDLLRRFHRTAQTVLSVLTAPTGYGEAVARAEALTASTAWRADPLAGLEVATQRAAAARAALTGVEVVSSRYVTLSSSRGRFPVTVANDLDEEVRVGVQLRSEDPAVQVEPVGDVTVGPQQKSTVAVIAEADRIGVTTLSVQLTTPEGEPFGAISSVSLRATQYGVIGWVIAGAGLVLLFVTSGARLVHRVRTAGSADSPAGRRG